MAYDPLNTDKPVFLCLPEKTVIGKWWTICNTQLALKNLSPAGPVLLLLDDIRERFLFVDFPGRKVYVNKPPAHSSTCVIWSSASGRLICVMPPLPLSNGD